MATARAIRHLGPVRCVLHLPSIDLDYDRRFYAPNQMAKLRRFIKKWLPSASGTLDSASFTISVEVLYEQHQGYRQVVLSRWTGGESVEDALNGATARWRALVVAKERRGQA